MSTDSDTKAALRVGAFTIVAVAGLAWLVLKVTSGSGFLPDRVHYKTQFSTIQGLSQGAEVRYKGVTVGEVQAVDFPEDPTLNAIVVDFGVRRSLAPRIDRHVSAELRTKGPLGDRILELQRPDLPPGEPLPEGAFVPARDPFEFAPFVEEGQDLFADIRSISQSLKVITNRLVAGEGLFGRLLEDAEFGEQTLTNLEVAIAGLRSIVEDSAEGRNLIGMLVGDEELARELAEDVRVSARRLEAVTGRLEAGEGLIGQGLQDDSELTVAVEDFRVAAASMRRFTERLEASDGLVGRLLFDEEYGDEAAEELLATLRSVRSIAAKMDSGEGTLGRLVNDADVYEGLNDIVTGIERSWFISFILKRKQKKGYQARVDRILRESPDPDAELLELLREVLDLEPEPVEASGTGEGAAAAGRGEP